MKEIWKAIEGFEGYYEISNLGRLKSLDRVVKCRTRSKMIAGKIMNPTPNKNGYLCVDLRKNGKRHGSRINRLVAIAFIPNPNDLPEVNHMDGNKKNNIASNLEWATGSQNTRHAVRYGFIDIGKAQKARKRPVICTTTGDQYASATEAAKMLGLNHQSISRVALGQRKSIHGYHFQFTDCATPPLD